MRKGGWILIKQGASFKLCITEHLIRLQRCILYEIIGSHKDVPNKWLMFSIYSFLKYNNTRKLQQSEKKKTWTFFWSFLFISSIFQRALNWNRCCDSSVVLPLSVTVDSRDFCCHRVAPEGFSFQHCHTMWICEPHLASCTLLSATQSARQTLSTGLVQLSESTFTYLFVIVSSYKRSFFLFFSFGHFLPLLDRLVETDRKGWERHTAKISTVRTQTGDHCNGHCQHGIFFKENKSALCLPLQSHSISLQ